MSRRQTTARELRHQKSHSNSKPQKSRDTGPTPPVTGSKSADLAGQLVAAIAERSESVAVTQVAAIEAAVEILASSAHESAATPSVSVDLCENTSRQSSMVQKPEPTGSVVDTRSKCEHSVDRAGNMAVPPQSKPESQKSVDGTSKADGPGKADGSGKANPLHVILGAFREGLTDLKSTLRDEFRTSLAELQAAQAAAAASQSEVLRTLTEVMFQAAAAPRESSGPTLDAALAGLEDRLLHRILELKPAAFNGPSVSGRDAAAPIPTPPTKSGLSVTTVKLKDASSVVSRSWEQIRNEMMTRGDFSDSSESSDRPSEQLPEVAPLTSDRHFRLPEQDPTLEVPRAIDPDVLSHEELRDAFREREAFVTTLIARIRRQQESTQGMLSKEQLRELVTELPEELAIQVRQTLKQMEDLARMGELELSLERARVARQVNQLEHTRQILEHNAKQLGMTLNPDGSIALNKNPVNRNSSSRRWLGKLGFGQ